MKKMLVIMSGREKNSLTKKTTAIFWNKVQLAIQQSLNIEYIDLKNVNIKNCLGCENCFCTGVCSIQNDDLSIIKEKMMTADGIFVATPVYLNHIPAELKNFFDRLAYWTHLFKLRGKIGGIIVTTSNSGADEVSSYIKRLYTNLGIKLICTAKYISLKNTINDIDIAVEELTCYLKENDNNFIVPKEMDYSFKLYRDSILQGMYSRFEYNYWKSHKMLDCSELQEIINLENHSDTFVGDDRNAEKISIYSSER